MFAVLFLGFRSLHFLHPRLYCSSPWRQECVDVFCLLNSSVTRVHPDAAALPLAAKEVCERIQTTSGQLSRIQTRRSQGDLAPLRLGRRDECGATSCRCTTKRVSKLSSAYLH